MVTRLPNSDHATLDISKIQDYFLNPSHPRGRHKARVFREALDLQRSDAAWLRGALLEAARTGEASEVAVDTWGAHWRLDATIRRHDRDVVVRTIWIVRPEENLHLRRLLPKGRPRSARAPARAPGRSENALEFVPDRRRLSLDI